eukprot:3671322-Lingulodinium_polyedra.AAC.1
MLAKRGCGRVKHIDTRVAFIQDRVEAKTLKIMRVPGVENPADLLTKYVTREVLERLRPSLGL